MGLLLSVLVVCVGFVELLAFLHNVRSHLVWPPVHPDLTPIDLSRLAEPSLTLNSHEDIELEYDEDITGRSRSPSPRREVHGDSPRRLVVSEPLKKSKSRDSIPAFLIEEEKNHYKPRYVLRECSEASAVLPRQFLVTEDQLVFEETDFEVPRCEFSSQEDEEVRRCVWPAPSGKIDVILRSTGRDTTEFWTNKVLVQPPGAKPAAEALVDERYLNSLDGLDKVKVVRRRGGSGRSFKKRRGAEDDAGTSRGGFENRETVAGKSSLECHGRSEREAGEPFWVKE